MTNLNDKIVLVTGSTSGIGKAIAEKLLQEGCRVILTGRNKAKIEKTLLNRDEFNQRISFIPADLLTEKGLETLVQEVNNTYKQVDIVVHSAGIIHIGDTASTGINILDKLYKVNFRAPYYITRGLLSNIVKQKGQLVFINSTAGLDSWAKVGQYAASKHALRAWVKSLREELSGKGVRIINIFAGSTDSPMQQYVQKVYNTTYQPEQFLPAQQLAEIVVNTLKVSREAIVSDIVVKPSVYEKVKRLKKSK